MVGAKDAEVVAEVESGITGVVEGEGFDAVVGSGVVVDVAAGNAVIGGVVIESVALGDVGVENAFAGVVKDEMVAAGEAGEADVADAAVAHASAENVGEEMTEGVVDVSGHGAGVADVECVVVVAAAEDDEDGGGVEVVAGVVVGDVAPRQLAEVELEVVREKGRDFRGLAGVGDVTDAEGALGEAYTVGAGVDMCDNPDGGRGPHGDGWAPVRQGLGGLGERSGAPDDKSLAVEAIAVGKVGMMHIEAVGIPSRRGATVNFRRYRQEKVKLT